MKGFNELLSMVAKRKIPWYRRWFNLPTWHYNKRMKIFTFQLFDCAVVHHPITKKHGLDLLEFAYRKWWQPKYIGFELWFP